VSVFYLRPANLKFKLNQKYLIEPLLDEVKNQNKPGTLYIVGFIGVPLRDNIVIIPPF